MYMCNKTGKRFVVWFTHKPRTVYFKYLMYYKSVNWTFFFVVCIRHVVEQNKKKTEERRELHIRVHVLDIWKNINSCGNSFVVTTLSSLWIYSGALALQTCNSSFKFLMSLLRIFFVEKYYRKRTFSSLWFISIEFYYVVLSTSKKIQKNSNTIDVCIGMSLLVVYSLKFLLCT